MKWSIIYRDNRLREIFVIGWETHKGTYSGTTFVEIVFLTIWAVFLYICVALSSLTLLASVFVLFILMSRVEDSRMGVNEGEEESRAILFL